MPEEDKVKISECITHAKQICDCDANRSDVIIMVKSRLEKELKNYQDLLRYDNTMQKYVDELKEAIDIYDNRLNNRMKN